MIDLSQKIAVVTGAAAGIGRASAQALASAGATVVVSDIDAIAGQETVALIERTGGRACFIAADVSDGASVVNLMDTVVARYGRIDCAHNNAGIEGHPARVAESSEADWDRLMGVNLKGVWLCMRAELSQMLRQGSGVIVNTASIGGLTAVPEGGVYSAAKHGVIGLTRTAAIDYATARIRVNAVCPGLTRTGMTDRLERDQPDVLARLLPPMGRMAEAGEIAGAVAFLLSDVASFITGHTLIIDGGATAI